MAPETQDETYGGNLAPEQHEKEAQVLRREGFEEELMEEGESEEGEQVDDVEEPDPTAE